MAEGCRQVGNWKPEDKAWEEPRMLEDKLSMAGNYFSKITFSPELGEALASLYMAEAAPAESAALKQTTYLAALLGFEGYIARMSMGPNDNRDGVTPEVAERYLGICSQLSDYCRSKVGYLNQDTPKGSGATKA
jgi:hypothetical protein